MSSGYRLLCSVNYQATCGNKLINAVHKNMQIALRNDENLFGVREQYIMRWNGLIILKFTFKNIIRWHKNSPYGLTETSWRDVKKLTTVSRRRCSLYIGSNIVGDPTCADASVACTSPGALHCSIIGSLCCSQIEIWATNTKRQVRPIKIESNSETSIHMTVWQRMWDKFVMRSLLPVSYLEYKQ